MFDLFDKVIEFNHNPTSESAKRKLDVVRLILRVKVIIHKTILNDDSATQHHNFVVTLFRMIATLF